MLSKVFYTVYDIYNDNIAKINIHIIISIATDTVVMAEIHAYMQMF